MIRLLHSSRAVSPLIATVLLIAFAVALGAVVMNWSVKYAPEVGTCEGVTLSIEHIAGQPDVCFDAQQQVLVFSVKTDEEDINGIKTSVIGTQGSHEAEMMQFVSANSIRKLQMSYDATVHGSPQKVIYWPIVMHQGSPLVCQAGGYEVENIPNC